MDNCLVDFFLSEYTALRVKQLAIESLLGFK